MDENELLEFLCRCSPAEFEQIVTLSVRSPADFPPDNVEQSIRAAKLLRLAGQAPENRRALDRALNTVRRRSGAIRLSPDWKPPRSLALLLGRREQEDAVEGRLRAALQQAANVVSFVLPGCADESPEVFVERCALFTHRRVITEAKPSVIVQFDEQAVEWPRSQWPHERRVARLREELGVRIGISTVGLDDAALASDVSNWLARGGVHKVLYYPIFVREVSRKDKSLIAYLIEFWGRVTASGPDVGATVFICLHCRPSWWHRRLGAAASCLRYLRSRLPDGCVLSHLQAPDREEIDPWVEVKCGQAWKLVSTGHTVGPAGSVLPLRRDVLKRNAKSAFGKHPRKSFERLKPDLENAIDAAHEEFLRSNETTM